MADSPRDPFDLSQTVVGLFRDGVARFVPQPAGPPRRIDGYTIGAPVVDRPAPHAGERHPDGDELLLVISGRVRLVLEEDAGVREVEIGAGQAFVVPRGVWHRVIPNEPSQILHVTPGPGGEHRPLPKPG